jgi:hypothetical protein
MPGIDPLRLNQLVDELELERSQIPPNSLGEPD